MMEEQKNGHVRILITLVYILDLWISEKYLKIS
jgi:hypothetical protein